MPSSKPGMQTLKAQGYDPIPGYRNIGLHPYAIALTEGPINVWGKKVDGVLCALRWPEPSEQKDMEIPLVVMARGERTMCLVSRSPKEYITRVLVEEDLAAGEGGSRPIASHLGDAASSLYITGNIRTLMYSKPEAFLVKQVGHFPDVSNKLIQAHLDKQDETSAMITAEWTMRNMFFGKWAFAFERAAALYKQLGRDEEARDTARLALKQPWWTVSDLEGGVTRQYNNNQRSLCSVRELANLGSTVEQTYEMFDQEANGDGRNDIPKEEPTPREIAMRKVNMLMDSVAAGEIATWDEIRPTLVEQLQLAGLMDSATFVQESTRMS